MKKICIALALLLCLGTVALGETTGVEVEVARVDGVSVVVFIPVEVIEEEAGLALDWKDADFKMPAHLIRIEEEAFAGTGIKSVEVSESVEEIANQAFANCAELSWIYIPSSVKKIADDAFNGCHDVTIYGVKESEAQRIATLCEFTFVDIYAPQSSPVTPIHPEEPIIGPVPLGEQEPVQLPFMKR